MAAHTAAVGQGDQGLGPLLHGAALGTGHRPGQWVAVVRAVLEHCIKGGTECIGFGFTATHHCTETVFAIQLRINPSRLTEPHTQTIRIFVLAFTQALDLAAMSHLDSLPARHRSSQIRTQIPLRSPGHLCVCVCAWVPLRVHGWVLFCARMSGMLKRRPCCSLCSRSVVLLV